MPTLSETLFGIQQFNEGNRRARLGEEFTSRRLDQQDTSLSQNERSLTQRDRQLGISETNAQTTRVSTLAKIQEGLTDRDRTNIDLMGNILRDVVGDDQQLDLNVARNKLRSQSAVLRNAGLGAAVDGLLAADDEAFTNGVTGLIGFSNAVARQAQNKRASTTINVGDKSATKFGETIAKNDADFFTETQSAGQAADQAIESINIARNIDVNTGSGETLKLAGRRIADAFGLSVNEDAISNPQAFIAVMGQMVNDRLTQEKGPQTDQDVVRFRETFANLDNPAKAKDFLLNYQEALQFRTKERASFFNQWVIDNPGSENLSSARKAWAEEINKTPLTGSFVDPASGLPMFLPEYLRIMRAANPSKTDADITEAWRARNQ